MEQKILWAVVLAAVCVLIFLAMWRGWRSRARRQAGLAAPQPVPETMDGRESELACPVQYVSTTTAGDWLDRITAHGLGPKGTATALVFPEGLVIARDGAKDLWIPAQSIEVMRRGSGMAGKFVEKEGLAVISWRLGETLVDTGLRTRLSQDTDLLLKALHRIAPDAADHLPESTTETSQTA